MTERLKLYSAKIYLPIFFSGKKIKHYVLSPNSDNRFYARQEGSNQEGHLDPGV